MKMTRCVKLRLACVLVVLLCPSSFGLDCNSFNTKTTLSKDRRSVTVRFALPQPCQDTLQVDMLLVSIRQGSGPPHSLCQIFGNDSRNTGSSPCQYDPNSKEYSLTRKMTEKSDEVLILSAEVKNGNNILENVPLKFAAGGSSEAAIEVFTKSSAERKNDVTIKTGEVTMGKAIIKLVSLQSGGTVETATKDGLKVNADTEDVEKVDDPRETTNFTQTPVFGFIVIASIVGIVVLLVVLILRQRGVTLPDLKPQCLRRTSGGASTASDRAPGSGRGIRVGTLPLPPVDTAPSSLLRNFGRYIRTGTLPTPPIPSTSRDSEDINDGYEVPVFKNTLRRATLKTSESSRSISVQVNRDSLLDPNYSEIVG